MNVRLSIIIVNYNVQFFLEQCLLSVQRACSGLNAEIFVVDNDSSDGSVAMVQEKFAQVNLIINPDNKGFSAANNQAMRIAKGQYILLLNPDTVVEEDTFKKCCDFMDGHPDAGGLGVQMIDGKGNFLPESKRGLPTPSVAFYKVFGFSALFPKSPVFGRYHLGFLDKNEVHKVDVLSGAFMMLRKEALEKTGFLDEDYFMYGEDIDLSYRITKAGYNNYYFPHTRIIHYKGESTKKSSVNYVFVFYRAMAIFARKHFAKRNAAFFYFLINIAIYIRAAAAIFKRVARKLFLPFADAALIFGGMYLLKNYWEYTVKDVHYPVIFMNAVVPLYILTWLSTAFLSGGYDNPVKVSRLVRGILYGAVVILVIYALLPESFRFSRALILLGTALAIVSTVSLRLLFNAAGFIKLSGREQKNLIIVGNQDETQRILSLLQMSGTTSSFIGFVNAGSEYENGPLKNYYLGTVENLADIVALYEANEVIFCSKELTSQQIIQQMLQANRFDVEYKIAPPESLYIIGSNSINEQGTLYFVDLHSVQQPSNRRNKRILDIVMSVAFLLLSPFMIFFQKNKQGYFQNIYKVLSGRCTWVGLSSQNSRIRKGVLTPSDGYPDEVSAAVKQRLEALYAKDYRPSNDFRIILRGLALLGRKT